MAGQRELGSDKWCEQPQSQISKKSKKEILQHGFHETIMNVEDSRRCRECNEVVTIVTDTVRPGWKCDCVVLVGDNESGSEDRSFHMHVVVVRDRDVSENSTGRKPIPGPPDINSTSTILGQPGQAMATIVHESDHPFENLECDQQVCGVCTELLINLDEATKYCINCDVPVIVNKPNHRNIRDDIVKKNNADLDADEENTHFTERQITAPSQLESEDNNSHSIRNLKVLSDWCTSCNNRLTILDDYAKYCKTCATIITIGDGEEERSAAENIKAMLLHGDFHIFKCENCKNSDTEKFRFEASIAGDVATHASDDLHLTCLRCNAIYGISDLNDGSGTTPLAQNSSCEPMSLVECQNAKCQNKEPDVFEIFYHDDGKLHKIRCLNCNAENIFPKLTATDAQPTKSSRLSAIFGQACSITTDVLKTVAKPAIQLLFRRAVQNVEDGKAATSGFQDMTVEQLISTGEMLIMSLVCDLGKVYFSAPAVEFVGKPLAIFLTKAAGSYVRRRMIKSA